MNVIVLLFLVLSSRQRSHTVQELVLMVWGQNARLQGESGGEERQKETPHKGL